LIDLTDRNTVGFFVSYYFERLGSRYGELGVLSGTLC
jgi:hypothetical protein